MVVSFFFFNDTAPTEIYTLSLHGALPICVYWIASHGRNAEGKPRPTRQQIFATTLELRDGVLGIRPVPTPDGKPLDRKSTRLNSSHANISYAVFCLKKKKQHTKNHYVIDV